MKKTLIILIISLSTGSVFAQKLNWNIQFKHVLDNREYFNRFGNAQTILGASLAPTVGFTIEKGHSVHGGFYYLFEYGGELDGVDPVLTLFYRFKSENLDVYLGSFPREGLLNYPIALLSDTLNYYRSNIQGGYLEYRWDWGRQNIWCDWTSRQTDFSHETFLAGTSGRVELKPLYLENYLYMYHEAGTKVPDEDHHIRDNGGGALFLGIDLKRTFNVDQMSIDGGVLSSYDRRRPADHAFTYGFMGRVNFLWKKVGMQAVYYKGDPVVLAYGDSNYLSGDYGRIDVAYYPYKSKRINIKADLGFHFNDKEVNTSQQLFVSVNLDFLNKK